MTGRIVIVPDELYEALQSRLDAEIAKVPDAAKDRDHLYRQLLAYVDEHGKIPDFSLERKKP